MKLPNVVVCVNASTQLNPREMASTTNSGFTISATEEGARYSGRNEQMAMNVAPSESPLGAGGTVYQRFPAVDAAGNGNLGIICHHDGIVHQHSHGYDESGEGGPVQTYAKKRHNEQCASDREYKGRANQYSCTHTHHQHDDYNHNQDGFYQIDDEPVVGFFGNHVFGIQTFQFQPHGDEGHEFGKPPVYQFTGFYHILCRVGGDADTDGALPVDVHDIAGRFHVSLFKMAMSPSLTCPPEVVITWLRISSTVV